MHKALEFIARSHNGPWSQYEICTDASTRKCLTSNYGTRMSIKPLSCSRGTTKWDEHRREGLPTHKFHQWDWQPQEWPHASAFLCPSCPRLSIQQTQSEGNEHVRQYCSKHMVYQNQGCLLVMTNTVHVEIRGAHVPCRRRTQLCQWESTNWHAKRNSARVGRDQLQPRVPQGNLQDHPWGIKHLCVVLVAEQNTRVAWVDDSNACVGPWLGMLKDCMQRRL